MVTGNAHLNSEMMRYDLCSTILEDQPSDKTLNASVCTLCYFKAQQFLSYIEVAYCNFYCSLTKLLCT